MENIIKKKKKSIEEGFALNNVNNRIKLYYGKESDYKKEMKKLNTEEAKGKF